MHSISMASSILEWRNLARNERNDPHRAKSVIRLLLLLLALLLLPLGGTLLEGPV